MLDLVLTSKERLVWKVLGDMMDLVTKTLSIIFEKLNKSGEVPTDWKKGNITPIFKKGNKEDPENCKRASLTSGPSKIMEQILLEAVLRHMENKEVPGDSQSGFPMDQPCLKNLVALHNGDTEILEVLVTVVNVDLV
ncbi:rna-directed dna polymerase from mobile element jockey-like [Willisornis vidua]|uniref:Rna-directed dna polymerase from mobile element jockey-like n=1 Tax=Willisornis vidua TaxID=1566151 RepID=A0ABQ9DIS0_9PASS|nr:rna-directed dna polymerase from mobile element jockey-like [Willisornis vidua]